MIAWRVVEALLVAVSTFIIGFVVTFALYLGWLQWENTGNSAQGDMGAFVLAMFSAPLCAIICAALSWHLTKTKYSD
jgi:hypothetical protein